MASTPPAFPEPGTARAWFFNAAAKLNVVIYRLSKGRLGARMQDLPVLILHTVGRKSGKVRQSPLLYLQDGDDYVVVAARGGSEAAPAWQRNLEAMPETMIEIKGAKRRVRSRRATPDEKTAYWPRLVERYSYYDDYQARTSREIAVVILTPVV